MRFQNNYAKKRESGITRDIDLFFFANSVRVAADRGGAPA